MSQSSGQKSPSIRNLEKVESWGMVTHAHSHVYRPIEPTELREVFEIARREGLSVALRGAGCSYGDASLNEEGINLDLTKMNRIIRWDPASGVVTAEPGLTLRELWQGTIEDGYWPPVVSGTMFTTLGGIAAMNIHGKNNFKMGPIGNHIVTFDLMLPNGQIMHCSREENAEIFHAAIGGFGMLGVFTQITLQMKKIYSGNLLVEPIVGRNLEEFFDRFEERLAESDYLVGWIDCIKSGKGLGRGVIHQANYLHEGEDPDPKESMRVSNQGLPGKIFGVIPAGLTYLMMRHFVNNSGMGLINAGKYWSSFYSLQGHRYLQSHAGFAFLLDYVPNWKWAYKPLGLIQYQPFVPKENARAVFRRIIETCQRAGLPPYLGVFKRHQPDAFLMSHALDGFSFALDFRVTPKNRERLWNLAHELDRIVLDAGGKFYFAKDSTLESETVRSSYGEQRLAKFHVLKQRLDPENLLQTNLSRRLFSFEKASENRHLKGVLGVSH